MPHALVAVCRVLYTPHIQTPILQRSCETIPLLFFLSLHSQDKTFYVIENTTGFWYANKFEENPLVLEQ
jgi:hypothetical protein